MPINKRDLAYLWDMRTAVREIMVARVWLTATKSLPELIILLDQIIPDETE